MIKKHIPNALTMLNLLSGLIALIFVFNDNIQMSFAFVCLGIFFDFWDGFAARVLKVESPIGLQLDSLADMVTSGVVPGLVMYKLLEGIQMNYEQYHVTEEFFFMKAVPFLGFIITLGSGLRLAKFNVDTRQTDSFIGLPTPANALFIMSLPLILSNYTFEWEYTLLSNPYVLVGITLFSAYIMNAELPLFSLKTKSKALGENKLALLFLGISAFLLLILQVEAIPLIIMIYLLMSIIIKNNAKK